MLGEGCLLHTDCGSAPAHVCTAPQAALRRYNVRASSRWEEFAALLPHDTDPMLAGVVDPARRQQLFVEIVAELQLQEALQVGGGGGAVCVLDVPSPPHARSKWFVPKGGGGEV